MTISLSPQADIAEHQYCTEETANQTRENQMTVS